ncbi:hypothetical protein JRQ81_017379 [Phrynocephalus forsythii]|uniref:Uncharacterized protein n=1 Tax=Phrynocephalus forsythii TaxID=171643 RepID=A0A9Q1AZL1_9SAUR|nr:hypothetical protein JRQ81_017379 [Phrynocephalus forsythii]
MERLNTDILGIFEIHWPNSGKSVTDGYHVYYSGNNKPHCFNGVGFIVHPNISNPVRKFVPVSDRVIFQQLNAQPILVNLIQVYAQTCDTSDDDIEEFYTQKLLYCL